MGNLVHSEVFLNILHNNRGRSVLLDFYDVGDQVVQDFFLNYFAGKTCKKNVLRRIAKVGQTKVIKCHRFWPLRP